MVKVRIVMNKKHLRTKSTNQTANLTASTPELVRIVQITDSHIFSEPDGCLLGLNTRESLTAVCKRVKQEEWLPDLLLTTGDLSQDASPEAYQYLAQALGELNIDTFWVAGNHDDPGVTSQFFTHPNIQPHDHVLIGNWQIVLLDSSVAGEVHGNLSKTQLEQMEHLLKEHADKNTLVVLHHHPIDINCDWIDKIGLKDNDEFLQIIRRNKNVKCVLWGHVHQEFDQVIDGVRWLASPSSCVQFTPGSKEFSADTQSPGYRYLELYNDGQIETRVHRVDSINFTIDYTIKGY